MIDNYGEEGTVHQRLRAERVTELICAEMLDVEGFDADNLVAQQIGQIQKRKLL